MKGKILDNDNIITRLENLKKEASEISRKVAETDQIMKEVEAVINQYQALSQACSSIYFTMDILNQIHSLYQYSLQYFLDIFNTVLTLNANLKDVKDSHQRLKIISKDLFYLAYYRLARGMLNDDRIVLALLFSKIYLKGFVSLSSAETSVIDTYFRSLMSSYTSGLIKSSEESTQASSKHNQITDEQDEALTHLSKMSDFISFKKTIQENSTEFFDWFNSSNPETNFSNNFKLTSEAASSSTQSAAHLTGVNTAIKKLLVIKAFRPDRFISSAELLINEIFGQEFLKQSEKMLDLANIVENEIKASTPILMCSVTGFDASGHVEDLAAETNKQIISIAIGSSEGFTQAEKAINTSSKTGRWVLLKNVHLASS